MASAIVCVMMAGERAKPSSIGIQGFAKYRQNRFGTSPSTWASSDLAGLSILRNSSIHKYTAAVQVPVYPVQGDLYKANLQPKPVPSTETAQDMVLLRFTSCTLYSHREHVNLPRWQALLGGAHSHRPLVPLWLSRQGRRPRPTRAEAPAWNPQNVPNPKV